MEYFRILSLVILLTAMIASCTKLSGNGSGSDSDYELVGTDGKSGGNTPSVGTISKSSSEDSADSSEVSEDKKTADLNSNGKASTESDNNASIGNPDNFDEPTLSVDPTVIPKDENTSIKDGIVDKKDDKNDLDEKKDADEKKDGKKEKDGDKKKEDKKKEKEAYNDSDYKFIPTDSGTNFWSLKNILMISSIAVLFLSNCIWFIIYLRVRSRQAKCDLEDSGSVGTVALKYEGSNQQQQKNYQQYQPVYGAKTSLYPSLQKL